MSDTKVTHEICPRVGEFLVTETVAGNTTTWTCATREAANASVAKRVEILKTLSTKVDR